MAFVMHVSVLSSAAYFGQLIRAAILPMLIAFINDEVHVNHFNHLMTVMVL